MSLEWTYTMNLLLCCAFQYSVDGCGEYLGMSSPAPFSSLFARQKKFSLQRTGRLNGKLVLSSFFQGNSWWVRYQLTNLLWQWQGLIRKDHIVLSTSARNLPGLKKRV